MNSQHSTPPTLSTTHRHKLEVESCNAPEVSAERGVRTITRGRDLPRGFSRRQRQRAPGMLFTVHRPNGETSYSFRPDEPDPENPGHKYEQPCKHYGGPGNVLDVHPSCQHLIESRDIPVIYVEGIKKADAIVSAARTAGVEVLVVAISGVWNWLSNGEPIPDMFEIPVEGRRVTILFDSDILINPSVQDAAKSFAEHLLSRGASVYVAYLPDQADGAKMGADDFLAAGHTLRELRLLTRPYNPADFTIVRLNRDERLRLASEDLERTFWNQEWKGQGGHTDRDLYLKLKEGANQHGKIHIDGIRVVKSWGALELEARISRRTLAKSLNRLEERGLIYRDNEGRKPDKTGAFVLRASVNHYGEGEDQKEKATQEVQGLYQRGLHLRAPRLRWSSPAYKPRRGTVRGTCIVRQGKKVEPRPAIKRLGKTRSAILDVVDSVGGTTTLQELAHILHKKRPRDLRRRSLPMLEEAGILTVEEDVVALTDDWLEKLEDQRELGREIEAEETARRRLELKRKAYHARHETKPDKAPTPEELVAQRERFEAAREARRRERALELRDKALAAFRSSSGAAKNLALFMDGELRNVQALVQSVLAFHEEPVVRWPQMWEDWRDPVLEAWAILAHERAPEAAPDWRKHALGCECDACVYPEPSYARPYRGRSA